jgi:hypothetical protein
MLDEASPSIDLRSLQSQNSFNVIPPTSRATNYVVLRYYDVKGDPEVPNPILFFTIESADVEGILWSAK